MKNAKTRIFQVVIHIIHKKTCVFSGLPSNRKELTFWAVVTKSSKKAVLRNILLTS